MRSLPPLFVLAAAALLLRLGSPDAQALGSPVDDDADFSNPLDSLPGGSGDEAGFDGDEGGEEGDAAGYDEADGADFDAAAFSGSDPEPLNALDSFTEAGDEGSGVADGAEAAVEAQPTLSPPSPLRGQGTPHRGMQGVDEPHFHEPEDEATCSADMPAPVPRGTDEEEIAKALAALEAARAAEAAAAPAASSSSGSSSSDSSNTSGAASRRAASSGVAAGDAGANPLDEVSPPPPLQHASTRGAAAAAGGALPHTHNRHHKHGDEGGAHFGRGAPDVIVASTRMFGSSGSGEEGEEEEGGSDVDSLQARGRAALQGDDAVGASTAAAGGEDEEGPWHYDLDDTTITVGHSHACVIVREAAATPVPTPPPRRRGIDGEDGADDEDALASEERRPYTSPISASSSDEESHGVGGRVVCWGSNIDSQLMVPRSLATIYKPHHMHSSLYAAHMAEVDALGISTTFAEGSEGGEDVTPAGSRASRSVLQPPHAELRLSQPSDLRFVQVSANDHYSCGITTEDRLVCWGRVPAFYGQATHAHRYIQVSAGCQHACGIRQDGSLHCFGRNHFGQASPPPGSYVQVACGWETCCAISTNASLACWGSDFGRLDLVPDGEFSQVSVSETGSACALRRDDGDMVCWGVMTGGGGRFYTRAGPYVQVSTSARLTCGIKQDARLDCFGEAHRLQRRPPGVSEDTLFLQISSHDASICGVTVDYEVICFGEGLELLHPTPQGVLAIS